MQITLTIDTALLSSDQVRALGALVGTELADAEQEQKDAAPVKATAKKAASGAKKAAAKPEPTPEPEEPEEAEEEAEEDEEDLVGDTAEPTMDDAVALATKLVSNKRAAEVKAKLAELKVKRVSELKGSKIATFVNDLQD